MARKAGFGVRRGPVTGRGRTCMLWPGLQIEAARVALKVPPPPRQAALQAGGGRGGSPGKGQTVGPCTPSSPL